MGIGVATIIALAMGKADREPQISSAGEVKTNEEREVSPAEKVNRIINGFNEEVSLEGAKMYSSNPYDYKESKYYKQLVELGLEAVPLMSEKICSGEITGLNQYLVGLAIQDITETDIAEAVGEGWGSGEQLAIVWKKFIQTAPERIEEILEEEESVDFKIKKLECYGVFGTAAVKGLNEDLSDGVLAQSLNHDISSKDFEKLEQYADSKNVNVEQVNQCFNYMYHNTENTKEIYWEKTENLGLPNKSIVRLESNPDNSDLRIVIDENSVNLESEEEKTYENYNFTKIIKSDFDKDGIMEIVLLFFGGSSGTYQDFRVIKFNGKTWEVIHRDFENRDDTPFVNVKALGNNCIQIDVEKTGYNKIVKLPKNKYLTEEGEKAEVGTGYRFFELQDDNIIVAYRVYVKNVGNGIGDVRQKIEFDENSGKLVLGETSYMAIKEAQERAYEGY